MSGLSDLGILLVLFTLAALLSVGFSAWAWIVGPAIKHLGRKWEEGKMQVHSEHRELLEREYRRGVDDGVRGHLYNKGVTMAMPSRDTGTAPLAPQKFTITGREIR